MAPFPEPPTPASPSSPDSAYRLPRTLEPVTYRLRLEPDLETATFAGTEEIDLMVVEGTSSIVCNAAELDVEDASLAAPDGTVQAATVTLDPSSERVTFGVDQPLAPGPVTLRCRFRGTLNDQLRGFYRSTFTDTEGVDRTIADHPDGGHRRPPGLPVLGRARPQGDLRRHPGRPERAGGVLELAGRRRDRPRRRPARGPSSAHHEDVDLPGGPSSSGRSRPPRPIDVDGVPVRVGPPPAKGHLTGFALEIAAHSLRFFAEYFDIPYPGEKLDLLAIPDFAFGAMENLGCVTFRETALLVDPDDGARSSSSSASPTWSPTSSPTCGSATS